jgi:hypothetical protein
MNFDRKASGWRIFELSAEFRTQPALPAAAEAFFHLPAAAAVLNAAGTLPMHQEVARVNFLS